MRFLRGKIFHRGILVIALLFTQLSVFADPGDDPGGLPGGGDTGCDPFNPSNCPLDTWVIVLIVIAAAFACLHLYKQQRDLSA